MSGMAFLVTNNGPHPPEKWADMTTRMIGDLIVIEPSAPTQAVIDKRTLETALFTLLIDLHQKMQDAEKANILNGGMLSEIDPSKQANAAADQIIALTVDTPFAEHFTKPEVRQHIYAVVGQHFADSMYIERSWQADRDPGNPASKEFRAKTTSTAPKG